MAWHHPIMTTYDISGVACEQKLLGVVLKLVSLWCFGNREFTSPPHVSLALLVSEQAVRAESWLARWTLLSWRWRHRGTRSAFSYENRSRALCIHSRCLFTINGHEYLSGREIFAGRRGAQTWDTVSWWSGPSDLCAHVRRHKCISQHP